MIWLGWTSNCWASSASVFSPLTAARATFALKAGVWFRRGRLLIVSPALRPSWPPSGRKPPLIQPVQKSRASSLAVALTAGAVALTSAGARPPADVVENTVFLISQYFCWIELTRREIQFID